jgi:hypothetical protein
VCVIAREYAVPQYVHGTRLRAVRIINFSDVAPGLFLCFAFRQHSVWPPARRCVHWRPLIVFALTGCATALASVEISRREKRANKWVLLRFAESTADGCLCLYFVLYIIRVWFGITDAAGFNGRLEIYRRGLLNDGAEREELSN